MSARTPAGFARDVGPAARAVVGAIRRMTVGFAGRVLWQLRGHELLDGEVETRDAEVFSGIGFAARPPAGGDVEAMVLFPGGGAGNPVVVATRDQRTLAAVLEADGELEPGEVLIHTRDYVVRLSSDGVRIRTPGGATDRLVKLSEFNAFVQGYNIHVHPDPISGFSGSPTVPEDPATGTETLEVE